ncbi:MAG: pilus assembly protein [Acidimicrobiales bacterium]
MRRHWIGDKRTGDPRPTERGAVLAEFALIVPVLVMILFGIIQFGFAISRAQAVEAAAREGGRLASLSSTTQTDIVNRVGATLAGALGDTTPTVLVEPGPCAGREGQSVTVTVTAPHRITIPLVLDHQTTLTGHAVFRCEA